MMIKLHLIRSIRFLPKVSYKMCLSLMLVLRSIVAEVVLRFLVGLPSEKCLFDVPVEEEETWFLPVLGHAWDLTMDNRYNLATTAASNAAVSCHIYIYDRTFLLHVFPNPEASSRRIILHTFQRSGKKYLKKKETRESNFVKQTKRKKNKILERNTIRLVKL